LELTLGKAMVRGVSVVVLCLLLAACGFHLRGQGNYRPAFQSIYVEGESRSTMVTELKRAISSSGATLPQKPEAAQAILQIVGETRNKSILSLSAAGRVVEYELRYQVAYRLRDAGGKELMPAGTVSLKRTISFSETEVLAKESEEALLYRDMESDAVQQIMRRLSAVK
jgi:LPS-assembly lipoprotein